MKLLSQTTVKKTIALVATCMFLITLAQAERICVITSRHLAHMGNKTDEFLQLVNRTANPPIAAISIRYNMRYYDDKEVNRFITLVMDKTSTEIPADIKSEIEVLLVSVAQFNFSINNAYLCDGENFNSSNFRHRISKRLDHFNVCWAITWFYMDKYYMK